MRGALWSTLGIEPTNDVAEIRRAYARRLKQVHPEDDPEGFRALREAYEEATALCRSNQIRALEEDLYGSQAGRPLQARPKWTAEPILAWSFPDSLTIDQMLDELALDEQREPELEQLRLDLTHKLRTYRNSDEHRAALERIFRSEAMASMRLHAETEAWVATLLRGNWPETEALLEASIAFYSWDKADNVRRQVGAEVVLRRDALALRDAFADRTHRLHRAWLALHRPFLDSYTLQYDLTPGLSARVVELLEAAERNSAFWQLLDPEAIRWWRVKLYGRRNFSPAYFALGFIILPLAVAKAATWNFPADWEGNPFFAIWMVGLFAYALAAGIALPIVGYLHKKADAAPDWIGELGDAAP